MKLATKKLGATNLASMKLATKKLGAMNLVAMKPATRELGTRTRSAAVVFLASMMGVGCGAQATSPAQTPSSTETLPTTIVTPDETTDVVELLARADRAREDGDYASARALYGRVIEHDADGAVTPDALFGLGTTLDLAAEPAEALAVYERFLSAAAPGARRERVEVRVVRLLTYLERYEQAERRARVLDTRDRPPLELVALFAARALGAIERGALEDAERDVSAGRGALEKLGVEHLDRLPLDAGALHFAEGEILARRAREVRFDPLPPQFAEVLERRCQLLLDAQSAYSNSMRAQSAHYSAMAGVRVGELYQELHEDLLSMPAPPAADTLERRQLVEGALRLRYSVLLDKATTLLEHTLRMLDRTGEKSAWAERARRSLEDLEKSRRAEEAALAQLPYTRAQLEQALRDLDARAP